MKQSVRLSPHVFYRCVEDSSDAIMITDTDGKLCYINSSWTRLYGYSVEDAIGKSPQVLHSGKQSPKFYRDMWNEIQDPLKGFWKGEIINRHKQGHFVTVMLTITPHRDDSGEIQGYMGLAIDLTEQKKLESQIVHQDRLATLGLLASGLAHEVGNPLGIIRGRAEILQMQNFENETLSASLGTIIGQIDRITEVIQTMLTFGRSEPEGRPTEVKAQRVLSDLAVLLDSKLEKSGIKLDTNVSQPDLQLVTLPSVLQQVLLNLILNSVQAIETAQKQHQSGGVISVYFKFEESSSKVIHLHIRDSGGGVSAEMAKKVFEPFFTTKVGTGTGLGLAIVSQLIAFLKGSISLEKNVIQDGVTGAHFHIQLPVDLRAE